MYCASNKSFTLIEVLITVTILSIVGVVGVLNLANYKNRHSFELDTTNVLESLRSAQNKSILGERGLSWGVRFVSDSNGGHYELFSGSTYATSSVLLYQALTGATKFSNPPVGFSETVLFAQASGIPDDAHVIVLRGGDANSINTVSISSAGLLKQTSERGLVGYWTFDEGSGNVAHDASFNGGDGVLTNNPTWQAGESCRVGRCLSFDGTNYVDGGNIEDFITSDFSIAAWVKKNVSGYYQTIVSKGDAGIGTNKGYRLRVESGDTILFTVTGDTESALNTTSTITNGLWYHIVATKDSSVMKVYINGIEVGNMAAPSGSISNSLHFMIGRQSTDWYWRGSIDDVRIYNKALSATEVRNLYESY